MKVKEISWISFRKTLVLDKWEFIISSLGTKNIISVE